MESVEFTRMLDELNHPYVVSRLFSGHWAKDTCSETDYVWAVKNLDKVNPMVRTDHANQLEADPFILHDYQIMSALSEMDAAAAAAYATRVVDECLSDGKLSLKPTYLVPSEPAVSAEEMDDQCEDKSVKGGELYSSSTDSDSGGGSSSGSKAQSQHTANKKRKRKSARKRKAD